MAPKASSGPRFVQYFDPILVALHHLGGSARPTEAIDRVARDLKITDAERAVPNQNGQSRFDNGNLAGSGSCILTTDGFKALGETSVL